MPTTYSPFSSTRDLLKVVDELSHLEPDARSERFRSLPAEQQQPVFRQLNAAYQEELLTRLNDQQSIPLLESLDPDDRARLFEALPRPKAEALRSGLSPQERALTDQLLEYPEESAGRIMSPEFLALEATMRVDEALAAIRTRGHAAETILALPVTDETNHFLGMATLDGLVFAEPESRVADIMVTDTPTVRAEEDQEAVARLMQSADALAIPVLSDDNQVLGLVTVDDAMDVMEFEESEDLARAGASEPLGRPYFAVSIRQLIQRRVVWLMLLALAATLTVNVLSYFEDVLDQIVSLSLFIPLLIGVGGNAGAQSATTIVRAMAVDDVRTKDLFRVSLREARVGLLLGSTLAVIAFLVVWLFFGQSLAIIVALSLVVICTLSSLVGSIMPLGAQRLGVDPAVVSAPFVTTIVDASGLIVYFLIAQAVFGV